MANIFGHPGYGICGAFDRYAIDERRIRRPNGAIRSENEQRDRHHALSHLINDLHKMGHGADGCAVEAVQRANRWPMVCCDTGRSTWFCNPDRSPLSYDIASDVFVRLECETPIHPDYPNQKSYVSPFAAVLELGYCLLYLDRERDDMEMTTNGTENRQAAPVV